MIKHFSLHMHNGHLVGMMPSHYTPCMCSAGLTIIDCTFSSQKNVIEPYFGDACQCDHLTSCGGSEDGVLCSGPNMHMFIRYNTGRNGIFPKGETYGNMADNH